MNLRVHLTLIPRSAADDPGSPRAVGLGVSFTAFSPPFPVPATGRLRLTAAPSLGDRKRHGLLDICAQVATAQASTAWAPSTASVAGAVHEDVDSSDKDETKDAKGPCQRNSVRADTRRKWNPRGIEP